MPTNRRILIVPLLLALTACGRDTPPTAELTQDALPDKPPEQFAGPVAAAGAVQDGWLAAFDEPVLLSLVAEALDKNGDLAAARFRLEQAAAQARQAGAPEHCPHGITASTIPRRPAEHPRPQPTGPVHRALPATVRPPNHAAAQRGRDRDAICQSCDEWNGNICEAAKCCQQNRARFLAVGVCPLGKWPRD